MCRFASPVDEMMEQLVGGGARVFYGYRLMNVVDVDPTDTAMSKDEGHPTPVHLMFENGGSAVTQQVMLNIPSEAIASMHHNSILFAKSSKLSHVGYSTPYAGISTKVYVQYKDAWWITKLGLFEGDIKAELNPKLQGRYHDAPVRCFDENGNQIPLNSNREQIARCNGLLLAAYFGSSDPIRERFYSNYQATDDPLTIVDREKKDERFELLKSVHDRLMEHHKDEFAAAGFNTSSIELPEFLYMANWKNDNPITSSIHDWPKFIPGAGYGAIVKALLRPVPGYDIFIANEAFGVNPGWAEGSVLMAERVLALEMGIGKPSWLLDDSYYESSVLDLDYFDLLTVQLFNHNLPLTGAST